MPAPDHAKALTILKAALRDAQGFKATKLTAKQQADIKAIILGTHLTFRYLLITALLAKVTEQRIHMRSLQTRADLDGAYDARSLCHKVWVPFERSALDCRLGGSNEPYLNKPARFPSIAKTNAVRGGNDKALLDRLYDLLEGLNSLSAQEHKEAFLYAMALIQSRDGATVGDVDLAPVALTAMRTRHFLSLFLASSFGGETAVAAVGAIMAVRFGKGYQVEVHPANQAGSSSNEIGDIDVYEGKRLILPMEVKDKKFNRTDVEHAIAKAKQACGRMLFVTGQHAVTGDDVRPDALVASHAQAGFDLAFVSVDQLIQADLPLMSEGQRRTFVQLMQVNLATMRAKDEAKSHFTDCLANAGLVED